MQQLRCAAPPPGGPRGAARGYFMSAMSELLEDMNDVLESSPQTKDRQSERTHQLSRSYP